MLQPSTEPSWYRWVRLSRVNILAGTMLTFWPVCWTVSMWAHKASVPLSSYVFLLAYGLLGTAAAHSNFLTLLWYHISVIQGAGCIWNDIMDRDVDRQVERTKDRPIASGQVSVAGGLVFLGFHLAFLLALVWPFNLTAWLLALWTLIPMPGVYPLMKRITYWPPAFLGLAVNLPVIVTWLALRSEVSSAAYLLMAACWCWTLHYDTIYGSQDKKDDAKAGVKSAALLFGNNIRLIMIIFSTGLISCLALAGMINEQRFWFFLVSIGGGALHLLTQIFLVNFDDPNSCLKHFESNAWQFGFIVWTGLFLDYYM